MPSLSSSSSDDSHCLRFAALPPFLAGCFLDALRAAEALPPDAGPPLAPMRRALRTAGGGRQQEAGQG
jgi:hypothetical protein